jgi:type IV pilus assembly protein PilO
MSTTAVIPPPNSSSLTERVRRVPRLTARARALLTAMNLHFAGVAALIVLDLYLIVHLAFVWQGVNATNQDAIYAEQARLKAAVIAAQPLRGLDAKLVTSTQDADTFYQKRLPYAVSQVAAELGILTKKEGVRLTRTQYAYSTELSGADSLTEMRIDASVSGDYRPIVQFINAAERDKLFFVINSINTGQQTGQVNLRVRLTTYLRAPNTKEAGDTAAIAETNAQPSSPEGGTQ